MIMGNMLRITVAENSGMFHWLLLMEYVAEV